MATATFVRDVSENFYGEARLYATNDPRGFVVVSSVQGSLDIFTGRRDTSETMVFASDGLGNVVDWADLGVAYPSGEFVAALADAGYEVV